MKMGTAPVSMTTFVCKKVPEAMLVNAQAASNCCKDKENTRIIVWKLLIVTVFNYTLL